MALTATQQARLDEIDAILARGVSSSTTASGRRIDYDLAELRKEREELRSLAIVSRVGSRFRRVVFADG
jgi:hypothetical protein